MPATKKTLFRGADGTLYLLSKNEAPQPLTSAQKGEVEKQLGKAEETFSSAIETAIPALGSGVHLSITEVDVS